MAPTWGPPPALVSLLPSAPPPVLHPVAQAQGPAQDQGLPLDQDPDQAQGLGLGRGQSQGPVLVTLVAATLQVAAAVAAATLEVAAAAAAVVAMLLHQAQVGFILAAPKACSIVL